MPGGCLGGNSAPPPLIFNVIVDLIIRNYLGLVSDIKAYPDIFGYTVEEKAELFYSDSGLVASTNQAWLQWVFYVLINLFEQVDIRKNVAKIVTMMC